ncbi:lysis system o-spanin lipoprotein Rz1 [Pseudomonas sp. N40(2020)]|uniref:lysis system o-spanin lipoprotein Rz1 n=1 Tax=Pseudomonas sp. N40(2020) TaxID=2767798 RepID=UPI003974D427
MPNVIRIACAIVLPLLMCACQSFSTPATLPPAVRCQPPPAPAAWIMQPYAPDLTRRMLNELSPSPTPATAD